MQTSSLDLLRRRQVYLKQAALKKGSSIEYVSENRIFTDADDYSMEIELPLADCPQNLDIFGMITRKDVDAGGIFFDLGQKSETPQVGKTDSRGFVLEA